MASKQESRPQQKKLFDPFWLKSKTKHLKICAGEQKVLKENSETEGNQVIDWKYIFPGICCKMGHPNGYIFHYDFDPVLVTNG